jgi:LysM repeat protein
MKPKYALNILFISLWIFCLQPLAFALKYKPKTEETLSHVALIHYGDPKKYIYLVAANRIADPDRYPKGKTLWVPTVWKYRLKKGDNLSKVATKYLKDKKRAEFLAWLNRISKPKDIKAGALLTIPFLLKHRVQQGQSMVDVSRRYYFRTKPTSLLRKFNDKRTNALKPGEIILVPIFDHEASYDKVKERVKNYEERRSKAAKEARERALDKPVSDSKTIEVKDPKSTDAKKDPGDSKTPGDDKTDKILSAGLEDEDKKTTPPEDTSLIQEAFELYRDGEYDLAQASLLRVLEKGRLSKADEAEAREILAFCLVAKDQTKDAEHEFVRLLMVSPDRTLDPITTSPKILKVFKRAKGTR